MTIVIEGTNSEWISYFLTWLVAVIDWKWIISTIVAIAAVVWQVKEQFKKNRELQKDTIRYGFHLEIYKDINVLIDATVDAYISASNNMRMILSGVEEVVASENDQQATGFYNLREQEFTDLDKILSKAISRLVSKIEGHEIIHKNLYIFRFALNSAHRDLFEAKSALFPIFLCTLPIDIPEDRQGELREKTYFPPAPTIEQLNAIWPFAEAYINACGDIGCYIHDLQIALQNILLGGLFPKENVVPNRKPFDPKFKVIVLEPPNKVEELRDYFFNETAWGKANHKAETRVRVELDIPSSES